MSSLNELIGLMKNPTASELALVEKAYSFAETAHRSHKRYSGEPYLEHLSETAKILAELHMGSATIAASLLHDTMEDVGATSENIKKEFGEEILMLVEGVTKLGHLRYRGVDRYSESLRRFFIASSQDIRVVIIKLADRLHNMRTLGFVPKEKQQRIAMETLEIYAPLAYRLGIRRINRELQNLSFPFAHPDEYARVKTLVKERESELTKKIEKFHKSLLKGLAKQNTIPTATNHRIKGLYSLYMKLQNRDWDLEKIYDILAVRVTVKTVEDCYRTLGAVHAFLRPLPGRIKDYIAFPKPNGYRSLHTTVFTGDRGVIEIQIRTEEMHYESEYGVAAHFEYKERGGRSGENSSYLEWAKQLLSSLINWRAENTAEETAIPPNRQLQENGDTPEWIRRLGEVGSLNEEQEFWTHLKDDFFKNRVFVFTPKGDAIDLPTDSSPVDFAYAIHSDIGDHIYGAKVNNKLVALDTALRNGDIVEILTKESAHPTDKWLQLAKTTLAKKHIRNALTRIKL